ncbi:MAG TPA: dihydrolipoamide acetyltransferase family protein [Candidatus Tectomicrobia bacterium]|jgi:pyruvate dehydrogenase E2 component (dihydrolipoamide acetyltransferase)
MALEFRFPDVGEGIAEGEIVRWLIKEGDTVQVDQPLVEVETDKAVVEIPAPRAGTILSLAVQEGEKIQVGHVLVVIGDAGEQITASKPIAVESTVAPSVSVVGTLGGTTVELPPPPELVQTTAVPAKTPRILAIPSVRKLARDLAVDLTRVTPTGPHGRIRREDVLQAAQQHPAAVPVLPMNQGRDDYGPIELLSLPALRRTIAEAMVHAATTTVPVTTTDEVDVTDLVDLRQRVRDVAAAQNVQVTLLPFIMKAVVATLYQHPQMNATLAADQRQLILKRYYHLGIATDTPDGLIVPVVKDVDHKNILTLASELQRLTSLARERRIPLADLQGGTFTMSNYGAIGGIFATPMLHVPEVAILGVGKLLQKPIVHEGHIAIRTVLPLSLTFDHRALDGATAQRFLNDLLAYLADPARLLLVL